MSRSVKVAISLPDKEFRELEALRQEAGVSRSKFILQAIEYWKAAKEEERLVRIYQEGYRRVPENLTDLEAWEKASLGAFSQGEW